MQVNDRLTTPDNFRFIIADNRTIAEILYHVVKLRTFKDNGRDKETEEETIAFFERYLRGEKVVRDFMDIHYHRFVIQGLKEAANDAKWKSRLQIQEAHNLVPSVLRNALATLISGTAVLPTFHAEYLALGSGSTAAANSDTQLGTETARAAFTDRSAALNIAYLDCFFPTATVGGNSYNEVGIFVDGSASANTGYLLSRVLTTLTLGANQTLTVNASITIS